MKKLLTGAGAAALLSLVPLAHADSFAINEYSASDLGRANAGRVVQTEDASAAFGNPALMTAFDRHQASLSVSGIFGESNFEDRGSQDVLGAPLGGDTSGFLQDAAVPAAHGIFVINDRWRAGLSVTAPFGLATEYEPDWPGRYQAIESDLQAININPSLAFAVTDTFSVGAGVNAQYVDAKLTSAIDFGSVCFARLGPANCAGLGLTPQSADGLSSIEGDDWSYGWNAGLTWTPDPTVRVGLHYRSKMEHDLEGDADFTVPAQAQPLTMTGAFVDTPGRAGLNLPGSTELGVSWQATDRLTIYGDAIWTEWSNLEELRVDFDNPVQPDAVEELNYQDAGRYAIGADYQLNDAFVIRAGYAADETPVQEDFRSARIPDNDRQIFALGGSWNATDAWTVDAAYNRVEIDDTSFDQVGSYGERVLGEYTGGADILSVGLSRKF